MLKQNVDSNVNRCFSSVKIILWTIFVLSKIMDVLNLHGSFGTRKICFWFNLIKLWCWIIIHCEKFILLLKQKCTKNHVLNNRFIIFHCCHFIFTKPLYSSLFECHRKYLSTQFWTIGFLIFMSTLTLVLTKMVWNKYQWFHWMEYQEVLIATLTLNNVGAGAEKLTSAPRKFQHTAEQNTDLRSHKCYILLHLSYCCTVY